MRVIKTNLLLNRIKQNTKRKTQENKIGSHCPLKVFIPEPITFHPWRHLEKEHGGVSQVNSYIIGTDGSRLANINA